MGFYAKIVTNGKITGFWQTVQATCRRVRKITARGLMCGLYCAWFEQYGETIAFSEMTSCLSVLVRKRPWKEKMARVYIVRARRYRVESRFETQQQERIWNFSGLLQLC